jgi:tetratricopeptide (TPR) repeat protein
MTASELPHEKADAQRISMIDNGVVASGRATVELHGTNVAARDLHIFNLYSGEEPSAGKPLYQLPPRLVDFTGRSQEIEKVEAELLNGDGHPWFSAFCLHGQGGVGKTSLAIEVAYRLLDRFPSGQLYLETSAGGVDRNTEVDVLLNMALRALGVHGKAVPPDRSEASALFRSVVSAERLLIVVDGAHDEWQVRPLICTSQGTRLLVTSRRRLSGLEGVAHLRVETMPENDARSLVQKIAGDERFAADTDALQGLVDGAAGLPLALRICGAKLAARPHWSVQHFVDLLSDEKSRLKALKIGDLAVTASIGLSYDDLPNDDQAKLRLLSLLGSHNFFIWEAAELLNEEVAAVEEFLESMVEAELLTAASGGPNNSIRYRFHDLVCQFLAERRADDPKESVSGALSRLMTRCAEMLDCANGLIETLDPLERPVPVGLTPDRAGWLVPNVRSWLDSMREACVDLVSRGHEQGLLRNAVNLAESLVPSLLAMAHWRETLKVTDEAVRAASANQDHEAISRIRRIRARAFESLSLWGRAEDELRLMEHGGPTEFNLGAAVTLRISGDLLRDQGRFSASLIDYERSLTIFRNLRSEWWIAVLLRSLGDTRRDVGDWDGSIRDLEESYARLVALGSSRWVGATLRSIATIYRDRGPYTEALARFDRALEIFEESGDRSMAAQTRQGLGDTYRNMGKFTEAAQHLAAAEDSLRALGDERRVMVAVRSLGDIDRRQGNFERASERLESCLQAFDELGDHRWGLYTRRTVSLLKADLGQFELAKSDLRSLISEFENLNDERWVANSRRCLADVQRLEGDHDAAILALVDAEGVFRRLKDYRWLGKSLRSRGISLMAGGERSIATECLVEALALFDQIDAQGEFSATEDLLDSWSRPDN